MGYVINKEGMKIKVDNPDGYCAENVVLINDDTVLVNKWIVNMFKKQLYEKGSESEFVAEILFDKEPTNDQIIYHLV